jgi:hypothetical protein
MALTKSPMKRKKSPEATQGTEPRKRKARKVKPLSPKPSVDSASKTVAPSDTTVGYTVDVPGVGVLDGFTAPRFRTMRIDDMLNSPGSSTDRTRAVLVEDASPRNHMSHLPSLVRGTVPLINGDPSPHVRCDKPMSSVHNSALTSLDNTSSLNNGNPSPVLSDKPVSSVHNSALTSLDGTSSTMIDTPQPLWDGAASTNGSTHAIQPTESMPSLPQDTQYSTGRSANRYDTLYVSRELHEDMQQAFRRVEHPPGSSETILGALTYGIANSLDELYETPQSLRYGRQPSTDSLNYAVGIMARYHPTPYDPNSTTSSST